MTLPSLITRLRDADGPSDDLDYEIYCLTARPGVTIIRTSRTDYPKVTATLDAAVALAERLGFKNWELEQYEGDCFAWLYGQGYTTKAASTHIALLIAILTAWGERQG